VSLEGFLVGNFSRAGYFEPFFCTGIGLNLWHFVRFISDTLLASRSGGNFWSLVGNLCRPIKTNEQMQPLKMDRKGKQLQ